MSLAGLFSAALYSLQKPLYPAFMAAAFNAAIIVCGLTLSERFEIQALAIGVLLGAMSQLLLQLAGVRRSGARLRWGIYHPAMKRLLILALPVLASLAIGQAQVVIDSNLASRTGEQSIAWMANATTLIQFPLGLVASAVSLAALPRLSRLATLEQGQSPFIATLAFSLRLVIVLILPATAILAVLGTPLIELLLEHGNFLPRDTAATSAALSFYLIGLPFAAIDQCLILAFYARGDTLRPALVGVSAVGIYLAVALCTMERWGMIGLVLANSFQWVWHALIMLASARLAIGSMAGRGVLRAGVQALVASLVTAAVTMLSLRLLPAAGHLCLAQEVLRVVVPGACGIATYLGSMAVLRNRDLLSLYQSLRRSVAVLR